MNIEKIYRKLNKYGIVSFDIFDTLLKRDVLFPADVFYVIEKRFDSLAAGRKSKYKSKRIEAENIARGKCKHREITFEEIYKEIEFSDEDKKLLKNMELEIESELLHGNPNVLSLFQKCIDNGKTVYVVSDMYLPKEFLETVLQRENIVGYRKLFLSCEYRQTKRSGFLFKELCNEEGIHPKNIIHIGDSIYADYIGPGKIGIRSIHIPRTEKNTIYYDRPHKNSSFSELCLFSFINSRINRLCNRNEKLGYEILGPIIYAYCAWLHENINTQFPDFKIWFVARDMYLFERGYKIMYGLQDDFEYIYLSRRSLRPIFTQTIGDITKTGEIFARGMYSLRQIIEYSGYSISDIDDAWTFNLEEKLYDARRLNEYPDVKKALNSVNILTSEKGLAELGIEYLENHEFCDRKILLADVGWHGTTQYLLSEIQNSLNIHASLYGMYLGCLDGTDKKIGKNSYKSFLFYENDNCSFMKGIILFECLILAPHGSTKMYRRNGSSIEPVLGKSEMVEPVIKDIQKGALKFVEEFDKSILSQVILLDSETVKRPFEKMAGYPKKEELDSIGDMEYDNFYCNKMAAPQNLFYYIFHISELKQDFKYSPWRIGFLYKLFRIRLPYAKVYSFLRKKQGKRT